LGSKEILKTSWPTIKHAYTIYTSLNSANCFEISKQQIPHGATSNSKTKEIHYTFCRDVLPKREEGSELL
jgi:hypothetical protein